MKGLTGVVLGAALFAAAGLTQAEGDMWSQIEGNWEQMAGAIQEKWGELTGDDLAQINGSREQLIGKIQEKYGVDLDTANAEVDAWLESVDIGS